MSAILVLTSLPDRAAAEKLAGILIERRVTACVSILAPCRSVYRWQGVIEQSDECPLWVKTTTDRYAALEGLIREHHPYELPEIVALSVERGLPAYLDWVAAETRP